MARKQTIKHIRATKAILDGASNLLEGEIGFATDTEDVFIGTVNGNKPLNYAESIRYNRDILNIWKSENFQDLGDEIAVYNQTVKKDVMVNSLEIQALKGNEINPDLSFFVDSFDNNSLIDNESFNYEINPQQGYIELKQSGDLEAKDTTKSQFDLGTFTNTESFNDIGGDGAVRKTLITEPTINVIYDGEVSNVSTPSSTIALSESNDPANVFNGNKALRVNVDFSAISLTESGSIQLDLTSIDVSASDSIVFHFLKRESGSIDYSITFEDTLSATYTTSQTELIQSFVYQEIVQTVPSIVGIDTTQLRYITFNLFEKSDGQVILDIQGQLNTTRLSIYAGRDLEQTFKVTEQVDCRRIKLRVRHKSGTPPNEDLQIAISNFFGTTLTTATFNVADATSTFAEYIIQFNDIVTLFPENPYSILVRSSHPTNTNSWEIHTTNSNTYPDGTLIYNGSVQNSDLHMTLYTPPIQEDIYFDYFTTEAGAEYATTGTFESRIINLGVLPDTLDFLSWQEIPDGDSLEVRIRLADSIANISSATWSSIFTDPSGVLNDLSGITPNVYIQYEVSFTGGTSLTSTVFEEILLQYSAVAGGASAEVISTVEYTNGAPNYYMMIWEQDLGATGAVNYYISRNGKTTWEAVPESNKGHIIYFGADTGSEVHIRAVMTGDAKLYGWGVATDKEFQSTPFDPLANQLVFHEKGESVPSGGIGLTISNIVTGIIESAISLNPSGNQNQLITYPSSSTSNFELQDFSINFWIKLNTLAQTENKTITKKGNSGVGGGGYEIVLLNNTGELNMILDGTTFFSGSAFIPDTNWNMVTIVFDRNGDKLFYLNDGSAVTDSATESMSITNTSDLLIGASTVGGLNDISAIIDEMRFYKGRLLTASDKTDIYNL